MAAPAAQSLQAVEDIDRSLGTSRAALRASFEHVRSIGPKAGISLSTTGRTTAWAAATTTTPTAAAQPGAGAGAEAGLGEGGGGAAAEGAAGPSPGTTPGSADVDPEENIAVDAAALARERNIQHAKIQQQHRIGVRIFNTEGFKAGLSCVGVVG